MLHWIAGVFGLDHKCRLALCGFVVIGNSGLTRGSIDKPFPGQFKASLLVAIENNSEVGIDFEGAVTSGYMCRHRHERQRSGCLALQSDGKTKQEDK